MWVQIDIWHQKFRTLFALFDVEYFRYICSLYKLNRYSAMRKRAFFIVLSMLMVLTGCGDSDNGISEEPQGPASRMVLVYMAAKNELGSSYYDMEDLKEMKQAAIEGQLGSGRWLVYNSPYSGNPTLLEVNGDGSFDTLKIYERGIVAAERDQMVDVLKTSRQFAPADKYGLVLWGHGSGWVMDGITYDRPIDTSGTIAYSYGPEQSTSMNVTSMNVTTLGEVLRYIGGYDYVYFDCCYMANVETAYELRNATDYIVGSATELLSAGMPYQLNMSSLINGSRESLIRAASNTFDLYNNQSKPSNQTCTMSVLSTAGLDRLALATRNIYSKASDSYIDGYNPQEFSLEAYKIPSKPVYFFDFKDYVHALADANEMDEALASEFDSAFADVVIYSVATKRLWNSLSLSRCNGLSTFLPDYSDASNSSKNAYTALSWYDKVVTAFNHN